MKIINFIRKKNTLEKLYLKFDKIPIWNFNEICTTRDLRYLLVLEDYSELPKIEVGEALWDSIFSEYLDFVGEEAEATEYRNKYNSFWELYWKQISTGDRKMLNKIEVLKRQLAAMQNEFKKDEGFDFDKQVAILDNHFVGVQFDIHKMSAKRYFTQLLIYKDYVKEMENRKLQNNTKN